MAIKGSSAEMGDPKGGGKGGGTSHCIHVGPRGAPVLGLWGRVGLSGDIWVRVGGKLCKRGWMASAWGGGGGAVGWGSWHRGGMGVRRPQCVCGMWGGGRPHKWWLSEIWHHLEVGTPQNRGRPKDGSLLWVLPYSWGVPTPPHPFMSPQGCCCGF